MGAFKDKILDELYKNNYVELYDIIDQMDSDVDIANYISSGKGYYPKMMSTKDLEGMPEFRKALYSELKTGEVDIDKEFGKDWYKNYEQIPSDQIKFVADKQGVPYGKLVNDMGKLATEKRRHDIAHDGTVSSFITNMVAPRSVEAVERGESPSGKDIALDIGQNVIYAAPWAKVTSPLVKYGMLGRLAQGTAGNALTPAIMETADYAAYDDPENPRSKWSGNDVATETAVNMTTPWLIRNVLKSAGKLGTGKASEFINDWSKFGDANQTTRQNITKELDNIRLKEHVKNEAANMGDYMDKPNMRARANSLNYSQNDLNRLAMADKLSNFAKELEIERKTKGAIKRTTRFTDDEIKFIASDPELSKFLNMDVNYPELLSNTDVAVQEGIKNWITNEAGGLFYDQQSPWTRIPIIGTRIDQKFKEQEKEEHEQAVRDSILYDLLMKYGEPRGL